MRATEMETAVRTAFTTETLKSRIVSEGPVALADVLKEMEARKAAGSLTSRIAEVEAELNAQRATNGWQ